MTNMALVSWMFSALFNHRAMAADAAGRSVFVFPGHGSQWTDMATELMEWAPAFADEMRSCDKAFAEFFDWSLLEVVVGDARRSPPAGIETSLPVSFGVMVSLAAQWRELGIHPDAVLGHSHGEIAAAYVAGGLTLRDAAMVVAMRTRAIATIAGSGGMASIELPVERVLTLTQPFGQSISVAAQNGPASTVVTGHAAALDELLVGLERHNVVGVRIPVDYAPHCDQVDELREPLRDSLARVEPRSSDVPFISALTGAQLDTAILDGDYWYANLRQPVLFEQAIRWCLQHDYPTFVECCPKPVLIAAIRDVLDDSDAA